MSRNGNSANASLDLWSIAEREFSKEKDKESTKATAEAAEIPLESNTEADENYVTLFLGDVGSGKSSLIQGFLKPTSSSKDPKPTVIYDLFNSIFLFNYSY